MRNLAIANMLLLLLGAAAPAVAAPQAKSMCNLPIPDTTPDGYIVSKENLWGDITKVELPFVYIKSGKTHKTVKVSLSSIKEAFTVYGGDMPFAKLQPGLQVWVWYENCKAPRKGVPNAAYFQIFSSDPKDRAMLDKYGKIISVPPDPANK